MTSNRVTHLEPEFSTPKATEVERKSRTTTNLLLDRISRQSEMRRRKGKNRERRSSKSNNNKSFRKMRAVTKLRQTFKAQASKTAI
jgi:hypothetical protein